MTVNPPVRLRPQELHRMAFGKIETICAAMCGFLVTFYSTSDEQILEYQNNIKFHVYILFSEYD
jgi:hypothetical protein